jgi:TolA-binding protein
MSDSAMQASHQMIQEAYFEVGNIYMNDIENRKRAIEAFRDLNSRYPSNPYIPGTYYYLYKLNNELGKDQKAQKYKQRIISEYPESNYAKVLKNPDYFRELEATRNRIEKMYARTLELYRKGRYSRAIDSCNHARSLFDQEKYLARFEYLKTLSIGHTSDLVTFRNRLQALIDDYPDSPVAEEATNTLSYLKKTELQQIGRKFSQNKPGKRTGQATGGKTKNGETPSSQQTNESSAGDSLYQFSREVPYYLVVVTNTETTDIGRLKFDLINFNLDYFLQKDYNTSSQTFNEFFTAVTVKRFDNYEEVKNYYDLLSKKEDRVFTQEQMDDYRYFFISVKNYVTLLDKKSIIEYINFFNRNVL